MANPYSGFPWFDDDSWIGRELAFEEPAPPRWKVAQRISESESLFNEWEFETAALGPKRALSFYATVSTIKPKEPIPSHGTAARVSQVGAKQAQLDVDGLAQHEIDT
ncbi:hypothetical protein BDV29DRAFT_154264 [Aspergillus leporis]|uniref:Uncharacterized protein n=1 Tax=Aspergillus leporis TaxID=41062 RepID=A0A5N5X834_9EURO|nr:hypothetical protein BDV29DRAFT_154264 [Aspergillus leporis]